MLLAMPRPHTQMEHPRCQRSRINLAAADQEIEESVDKCQADSQFKSRSHRRRTFLHFGSISNLLKFVIMFSPFWHEPIPVVIFCGVWSSISLICVLLKRGKCYCSSSDANIIPPPPCYEEATGLPNYQEAIVRESRASTVPETVVDPAMLTKVIVQHTLTIIKLE
jgi:hypothetical protein